MAEDTQANQHAGDAAQSAGQTGQQAGKTFTQSELDAIIQDRLGREKQKYADYDGLKAAKAELEKIKRSQMSETEKLQKTAGENERRAIEAESRIVSTRVGVNRTCRRRDQQSKGASTCSRSSPMLRSRRFSAELPFRHTRVGR